MLVGIYGGSFNPIHNGHIEILKYVREVLKLDKIFLIPVGKAVHKKNDLIDGELRLDMCKIATEKLEYVEVLDIEIKGKKKNYTYDTLMELKNIYPNYKFFEIIGEDSWDYFQSWKNADEILKNSVVVVLKREGDYSYLRDNRVIYLENRYFKFSSTYIREQIRAGNSIKGLVSTNVENFIKKNRLYIG